MRRVHPAPTSIYAHRGFSSRQPEMTLAAYQEAIRWSIDEGVPLGLECDVQLSADGELVCLHDPTLGRTARASGSVRDKTLEQLRRLDYGSWKIVRPTVAQRSLVTLAELLGLVAQARSFGAEITLAIETKHDVASPAALEPKVAELLAAHRWDAPGSPVRLITFSRPGAELMARVVPGVARTLLVEYSFGPYADGRLPDGIGVVGVEIRLLRRDPAFVARARRHGNEVHVWTANQPDDIAMCRQLGVTGITTDYPDRALKVLSTADPSERNLVLLERPRRQRRRLAA